MRTWLRCTAVAVVSIMLICGNAKIAKGCHINVITDTLVYLLGSGTFTGTIGGASEITYHHWQKNGVNLTDTGCYDSIPYPGNGSFTVTITGLHTGDVITCRIYEGSLHGYTAVSTAIVYDSVGGGEFDTGGHTGGGMGTGTGFGTGGRGSGEGGHTGGGTGKGTGTGFGTPRYIDANTGKGDGHAGTGTGFGGTGTTTAGTLSFNSVQQSVGSQAGIANVRTYPNPANTCSNIAFDAVADGHANIALYDLVTGAKVRDIFDGEVNAGIPYSFQLASGSLPPGLYCYKIVTETGIYISRLSVLN